jgi:hypothetical protein
VSLSKDDHQQPRHLAQKHRLRNARGDQSHFTQEPADLSMLEVAFTLRESDDLVPAEQRDKHKGPGAFALTG